MSSKLLGPDGREIPDYLCVTCNGKKFPYRIISKELVNSEDCKTRDLAILTQSTDQFNLILLMMLEMAKDMYSREPEGTRHFQDLAKQLNMNILDKARNEIDIAKELEKIVGS